VPIFTTYADEFTDGKVPFTLIVAEAPSAPFNPGSPIGPVSPFEMFINSQNEHAGAAATGVIIINTNIHSPIYLIRVFIINTSSIIIMTY
jgi:hypothetical protein